MAIAGRASVSPRCAPITASPSISRLTTESNHGLTSTMPRGFFRWRLKHSGLRRKLMRSRHSTLCRTVPGSSAVPFSPQPGACHHRTRTPEPKAPRGIASRSAKPVLFNDIDRWVLVSMRVQTFRSEFAVERLHEGVVSGLARSGEVERDAALISPEVEIAGDKLCALIDPDCFRETNLPADLFEYLNNIRAAKVEPSFDRRREARER